MKPESDEKSVSIGKLLQILTTRSIKSDEFYWILADFQCSFTDKLSREFTINSLLKIPQHLKRFAALPCKISLDLVRRWH